MAELDLPTIHLQRYFELVARRKHALVPFAVIGAIIGGIVAFLIPRYYEAYTIVRLSSHVLEADVRTDNPALDPFTREVDAAREMIRDEGFVAEAIGAISEAWTDYMPVGGRNARVHPKVMQAAKRVMFQDYNAARGRKVARIFIGYRDVDPRRACDLANSLRDTFLEREWNRVISSAKRELSFVRDALNEQERIFNERNTALRQFEFSKNVPSVETGANQWSKDPWDVIYTDWMAATSEVAKLEAESEGNKATIAGIEERITAGLIPESIAASAATMDPAVANKVAVLSERLAYYESSIGNLTERHISRSILETLAKGLREQIEEVKRTGGVDDTGLQPNPEFIKKKQQLNDLAIEQMRIKKELELKHKRTAELARQKDLLPELRGERNALRSSLEDTQRTRDKLRSDYSAKDLKWGELTSMGKAWEVEREASAPDEATYPQIWLIASAGCLAGVIAAFVLLVVADFFHNTFKTVDEVQRGLPVPVLGVGGYMESDAERRMLRRRRLAVSLSSVAALVLVTGVLGMYFWNKIQLPPFVASMLDRVFGR